MIQVGTPNRAIAPIRDPDTAASAVAALLDRDWRGVRAGAERTVENPGTGEGGTRRVLTLVSTAGGALVLLAGLIVGGVALGRNWDSLPIAAWLASDAEAADEPEEEPGGEEVRVPGPVAREPSPPPSEAEVSPSPSPSDDPEESPDPSPESSEPEETDGPEPDPVPATVPITVYNAEEPCRAPRTQECSLGLAHNPYGVYSDPGNRAGQVWHGDPLDATCMVGDGGTITDESGYSSNRWYKVATADGTTGWLPGARTRDAGQVRTCDQGEV